MEIHTTPIYAGIFGLVFSLLSFRALRLRRKYKVAVGFGDEPKLIRAISVHANFAEYVPLALILILLLEIQSQAGLQIHLLCIALLLGRLIHAYGVSQVNEDFKYRVVGMILTLGTIISSSSRLVALNI